MATSKHKRSGVQTSFAGDGGFSRLDGFLLNSVEDPVDLRDYAYQPALVQLKKEIPRPKNIKILNQGREGACTGFGLAAVINLLLSNRKEKRAVSARMLYEIAKKFDEWEGEDYSGSSCRGAILGWYNTGVCSEELAPYKASEQNWQLTIDRAKDARLTTLGAYYRINKRISDSSILMMVTLTTKENTGWTWPASKIPHISWRRKPILITCCFMPTAA